MPSGTVIEGFDSFAPHFVLKNCKCYRSFLDLAVLTLSTLLFLSCDQLCGFSRCVHRMDRLLHKVQELQILVGERGRPRHRCPCFRCTRFARGRERNQQQYCRDWTEKEVAPDVELIGRDQRLSGLRDVGDFGSSEAVCRADHTTKAHTSICTTEGVSLASRFETSVHG